MIARITIDVDLVDNRPYQDQIGNAVKAVWNGTKDNKNLNSPGAASNIKIRDREGVERAQWSVNIG